MKSKNYIRFAILSLCFLVFGIISTSAQTTEFTYQGRLLENGLASTANYDMQFRLFDDLAAGNQKGPTLTVAGVPVSNGIFTVHLDFGPQFAGNACYLQIGIRPAGSPNIFTDLNPRQPMSSAPYSVRSLEAATADVAENSNQLGGIPSSGFIHNGTTPQAGTDFNVSGNGTLGGALSANTVNAASEYDIGSSRVLTADGNANTFVGLQAGQSNTTGASNSFFGSGAGLANTIGHDNTFIGKGAGGSNVGGPALNNGDFNTFVGSLAGTSNVAGWNNSFYGYQAGYKNTTGEGNAFFGQGAGFSNTTAAGNSFFGARAGENTTSSANSFFGSAAGGQNTTGTFNSIFGFAAGGNNTTGSRNAFFGLDAGFLDVVGDENSFFGSNAGETSIGSKNSAFGSAALTAANVNNGTAIGAKAFVTQDNSLVLGSINGVNAATADTSVGIGTTAPKAPLHIAANGTNTLIGYAGCLPGYGGVGFASSLACGNFSLSGNGTDTVINRPTGGSIYFNQNNFTEARISPVGDLSVNTKIGIGTTAPQALLHIAGAGRSILFGPLAGCPYIGIGFASSLTCPTAALFSNGTDTTINRPAGGSMFFTQNNAQEARFTPAGDFVVSHSLFIGTLGSAGSTALCRNASNQISTCSSSLRYKKDMQPFTRGLTLLDQLKPITFRWKADDSADLGFGAEDIAKVEPLLVTHNDKGEVEGVKYDRISAVLVNAVKEQQEQIESLRRQLEQQQILTEGLKKLVCQKKVQREVCK
jgi:hypothetical protein